MASLRLLLRHSIIFATAYFLVSFCGPAAAQENSPRFQDQVIQPAPVDSSKHEIKRKKSPRGAMLRSLAFPGWGQWYNNQKIKSVLVFSAQSTLIGFSIYYNKKARNAVDSTQEAIYIDKRNQMFWIMGGVTLLSMIDAYIDAYLYDFDAGPELALRAGALQNSAFGGIPTFGISLRANF